MSSTIIEIVRWLLIVPLSLLPGFWVSHGLGRHWFCARQKLGMALVLSPFVVAVQMLILRTVGLSFAASSWTVLCLNAPSVLLLRTPKGQTSNAGGWDWNNLLIVLLAGVGTIYAAYPWLTIDGYRVFSYHNFLYIDAMYALCQADRIVPEESQMAGYVLAYPWFSQLYASTVGMVSDIAPTILYCILNVIQLAALTVCIYSAARDELKMKWTSSALATGLVFWGQNIPGTVVGFFATGGTFAWAWMLGDLRTGPFLLKFNNANAMPFGLAILAAIVLTALIARRIGLGRTGPLLGLLLAALGTVYPALLPPAGLLAALVWLLAAAPIAKDRPKTSHVSLAAFVVFLALAACVSYLYKQVITGELHMAAIWLSEPAAMLRKAALFVVSMVLMLLPALLYFLRNARQLEWNTLILAGLVLICVALNVAFSMGGNIEYKFLYGASIGLALLAGLFVDKYVLMSPKAQGVLVVVIVGSLFMLYIKHSYGYNTLVPAHIARGPVVDESSFWLALGQNEADARWTRHVREKTPANAIVVTHGRKHHVGTYLARTLFIAQDGDELLRRIGYAETARYNLVKLRGYPSEVFEHRLLLIDEFYRTKEPHVVARILAEFSQFRRPVVIHFEGESFALQWFRDRQPHSIVFEEAGHAVCLLKPGD